MKNVVFTWVCCVWGLMFILSCSHDAYDYNQAKADYDNAFSNNVMNGDSIDPAQTWNASVMSTLNVSVNLDAGATYTLRVFTANPIYDKSATLLDITTCTSGSIAKMSFAKPMALSSVYLGIYDSKNGSTMQRVDFEGTAASVELGSSSAHAKTRANSYTSTNPSNYVKSWSDYGVDIDDISSKALDITALTEDQCGSLSNYKGKKGNYYYIIPSGKMFSNQVGLWIKSIILVKGTWVINSSQNIEKGTKLVICPGGKVILNNTLNFNESNSVFLNRGGTIESSTDQVITMNNTGDYYNDGKIDMPNGTISISGNGNNLYNAGNISIKLLFGSSWGTLVNNGYFYAQSTAANIDDIYYNTTSVSNFNLVNLCYTKIDRLGVYYLTVCDNSRVDSSVGIYTGGGNGGEVYMGAHSMVSVGKWVDNGVYMYGPSDISNGAVFKFSSTICELYGSHFQTHGYIYYDGDLSNDNDANPYFMDFHYQLTVIRSGYWWGKKICKYPITYTCSESTAPSTLNIPKGECTGAGYNPDNNPPTPPVVTPSTYYYAYEDLGSIGDYDFNDVVIAVKYPIVVGTQKNAEIYLVAAGGTLTTSVSYGSTVICDEVHSKFGVGTSTMVNTTAKTLPEQLLYTITNTPDGFDASNLNISIYVNGYVSAEISPNVQSGKIPQMIKVPSPWKWPKETTNISDAYSTSGHSFGAWGSNYAANTSWYLYPVSGRVVE